MRRLLLLAAAALLVAGALAFALLRPASREASLAPAGKRVALVPPAKRRPLPDLSGPTLLPPPASFALASLRGRPAFLSAWASWCPSCRKEAPAMARLARRFGRQVRFVGIDVTDPREDGRAFVRRYGLDYPHLFDPKASIAGKLGVFGVPTAFLVDRRGRIAAVLVGRQREERLARYLRLLAAEAGP